MSKKFLIPFLLLVVAILAISLFSARLQVASGPIMDPNGFAQGSGIDPHGVAEGNGFDPHGVAGGPIIEPYQVAGGPIIEPVG